MGYRAGMFVDPTADPRDMIDRLCGFLDAKSGRGLRVRHRDQRHLVVVRKRLVVFCVALMISTLVPGPGFLLGYWLIHRNSKWLLTLSREAHGTGCLIRWSLRAPIDQAEMDARLPSTCPAKDLSTAVGLISHP